MDRKKIKELEAKGFKIGDVTDFLELTDEDVALIETRLALSRKMREVRRRRRLTQVEVARRINSSQSRLSKIEAGDKSVTIDRIMSALFTLGVSREEVAEAIAK